MLATMRAMRSAWRRISCLFLMRVVQRCLAGGSIQKCSDTFQNQLKLAMRGIGKAIKLAGVSAMLFQRVESERCRQLSELPAPRFQLMGKFS